MATVVIAPMPFPGHVNPTLKLAAVLQAQGHRVCFLTIPEVEGTLRAAGFEVEVLFAEIFPSGSLADFAARFQQLRGWRRIALVRGLIRRINRMLQGLIDGVADRALATLRPDLVLCDVLLPPLLLVTRGLGIPTSLLNTSVLPMRTRPGEGPRGAAAVLHRLLHAARAQLGERVVTWLGLNPQYRRCALRLGRKHHVPIRNAPPFFEMRELPELMLCPREFAEGTGLVSEGPLHHLGPCIALDRQEPEFPWERLEEGKPLILFSLGTVPFQSAQTHRLFEAAVAAAAQRPGWQLVIAVSAAFDPAPFDRASPNVIAVRQAPQLQLLQRAAAMVTHAGFNSVKECVYFGVPMVVMPLMFDQPMIARLVTHHGLGLELSAFEMTAEKLVALLDRVVGEPSFARAMAPMQARFREAEEPSTMAGTIERLLPPAPPPA